MFKENHQINFNRNYNQNFKILAKELRANKQNYSLLYKIRNKKSIFKLHNQLKT